MISAPAIQFDGARDATNTSYNTATAIGLIPDTITVAGVAQTKTTGTPSGAQFSVAQQAADPDGTTPRGSTITFGTAPGASATITANEESHSVTPGGAITINGATITLSATQRMFSDVRDQINATSS